MVKSTVQSQFGPSAAAYASSSVHARGPSLARLVELIKPESEWLVLDVATGAGHTALALASRVRRVIASDVTLEMLQQTASLAELQGHENVRLLAADAQHLPIASGTVDLITCRLAAHHFPDIPAFVAEGARLLRPGGLLAVVDNVVPGSFRRGKQARRLQEAGRYINAFDRLRDPSHARCLSLDEWQRAYYEAGLRLRDQETLDMILEFNPWVARMRVAPDDVTRLKVMLLQAPDAAAEFLRPRFDGEQISFRFEEAILVGEKPLSSA